MFITVKCPIISFILRPNVHAKTGYGDMSYDPITTGLRIDSDNIKISIKRLYIFAR